MYGIMLVNDAGETAASVGWDQLEGDAAMFGGFVSAIQMFIKRIAGGNEVREMVFGDMKLLIGSSKHFHVVTLHGSDEKDASNANNQVVNLVNENTTESVDEGILNLIKELVDMKSDMSEQVEESVKDWTQSQVEKTKKSASDWAKTVF